MIAAMTGLPSLSIALRYLAYGVLIAVMLIKPALAFATEIGELAAPAAHDHPHAGGHAANGNEPSDPADPAGSTHNEAAPAPIDLAQADPADERDPDGCGDTQWHLSHCCAMQAALMPRFLIGLSVQGANAPKPLAVNAFVPKPTAVPFRPPITA